MAPPGRPTPRARCTSRQPATYNSCYPTAFEVPVPSSIQMQMGPAAFASYKRLAYKWWFAFAEFVDNSTQSYFNNRTALDAAYASAGDSLMVRIATDPSTITIWDNAMGMDLAELELALSVGIPPSNATGRCRYGMGMKTAASWIGNRWTIRTTKLGSAKVYAVTVDVDAVAAGRLDLPVTEETAEIDAHFTVLTISDHHRPLRGRAIGKVKDFLSSIYRVDLEKKELRLRYDDVDLKWERYPDGVFLKRADGTPYKKHIEFEIKSESGGTGHKRVSGWVGILETGSRQEAGFAILHRERVIRGWPGSWRPFKLFGEGRNDLVNQRLVGEVRLEDFEVSHTKDDINWYGREEEEVEKGLNECVRDYARKAREHRKKAGDEGPSAFEVKAALKGIEEEIASDAFLEALELSDAVPPAENIKKENAQIVTNAAALEPTMRVKVGPSLVAAIYLDDRASVFEPYFTSHSEASGVVQVVMNTNHPHWSMLHGEAALENYLRHCVYDAIAEHKARVLSRLDIDSLKRIKDQYLRVAFKIVQAEDPDEEGEDAEGDE